MDGDREEKEDRDGAREREKWREEDRGVRKTKGGRACTITFAYNQERSRANTK